jgi:hypothetical protein
MKLVDTAGRVEKFRTKYQAGAPAPKRHVSKKRRKAVEAAERSPEEED